MASIASKVEVLPSGQRIVIRAALPDDAAALIDHRLHVARTSEHNAADPEEVNQDVEKVKSSINESGSKPYELLIVAFEETTPATAPLVIGELEFQSFNRRVLAHHGRFGISVDEEWRGRGVGSALIRTLFDWAHDHPTLEKITLGVYENNVGAIRLYERMGFKLEGRREKFFKKGPGCYIDDLQMAVWIKPPR